MDARKHEIGELVQVDLPAGLHLGRIIGHEDGRNLRRWDGPFPGWAYHVRLEGVGGPGETVIVPEGRVSHSVEGVMG